MPLSALGSTVGCESSSSVRERVEATRAVQRIPYANAPAACNARASGRMLFGALSLDARNLLDDAAESLSLSARAYYRVVKVAHTIADLGREERLVPEHIAEALRYRQQIPKRARTRR